MKPKQAGPGLAAGFDHVARKAEDAVDSPHYREVAHKRSLALDPGHPTAALQFREHLAGGGIADLVFLDNLVLGGHRCAGGQLALLDAGNEFAADLEILGRMEFTE